MAIPIPIQPILISILLQLVNQIYSENKYGEYYLELISEMIASCVVAILSPVGMHIDPSAEDLYFMMIFSSSKRAVHFMCK